VGVTHYAALWCPDFPPQKIGAIRRSACRQSYLEKALSVYFFRNIQNKNYAIFAQVFVDKKKSISSPFGFVFLYLSFKYCQWNIL